MISSKTLLFLFLGISLLFASPPDEGLIAVISGRMTNNGMPLLCQNIYSDNANIKLKHFKGPKYDFTGLIQNNDSTQVWIGQNSSGLSLVGTLVETDSSAIVTTGHIIKHALGFCARLDEFGQFLENQTSSVSANFGCLDKFGNVAVFETSLQGISKLDVNNRLDAEYGFLVRSNFSFSHSQTGKGVFRYHRAVELLKDGFERDSLNVKYIFQHVLRDIKTDEGVPLLNTTGGDRDDEKFFATDQGINQYNTIASAVFSSPKDINQHSTNPFWCALGEPICSVFVPVWTVCSSIPEDLSAGEQVAMNILSRQLKQALYHQKSNPKLIDLNEGLKGKKPIFSLINNIENNIFLKFEKQIEIWTSSTEPSIDNICQFQHEIISDAVRQIR